MELVRCEKYYDLVMERWPELSRKQVDKIVKHGLLSLYTHNLYGGDVLFKTNDYTMYFGKLFKSNLVFYKYWQIKWRIKLRIKYLKEKIQYDGYYYFGLTDGEFEKYKAQMNKRGKRRKHFHFDSIMLYKIKEECMLRHEFNHFFRVAFPEDCGFKMYKKNWTVKDFDYILRKNKDKIIEPVSYEQKGNNKHMKRRVK